MTMSLPITFETTRPKPVRYPDDVEHLDGAARSELRMPHCTSCGQEFWPPGPVCPNDFSADLDWVTDSGAGVVNSWVRCHKAYFEGDEVPFVVVQVTLDSGPRLTTTWTGGESPVVGAPVVVSFSEVGPDLWLPEFGPAKP